MATLNYERRLFKHFGVCSSGFSLSSVPFEATMRMRMADGGMDSLATFV